MFTNERFQIIADYLKEHKKATVNDLAGILFVSTATVRRDLMEMQKLGMVARTHGGALSIENADEVSIFVRLEKNAREKEEAASVLLAHLPSFQTVFIDNSSTCLALAERMDLTHKTVITNGLQVAMKISQKENVQTIMPGGVIHFNTNAVEGGMTCNELQKLDVDLMLLSCVAVSNQGTFEVSVETAQLKQAALAHSKKKVLVVDSNKFFQTAPYRTALLSEFDFIATNADDKTVAPIRAAGITVYNKI